MAKFGTSSLVDMFATAGDEDGDAVDVGTENGPCASIRDEDDVDVGVGDGPPTSIGDGDGLTSIRGEDGVGATLK